MLAVAGLLILVAGFAGGYWLGHPSTVVKRITMWLSPWDNAAPGGDQVAQALWALASGGVTGQGAGRGGTGYIPTGENDLVLASLGEDLGFLGLVAALVLFGVFVARALRIARRSDDPVSEPARRRPGDVARRAGGADCRRPARPAAALGRRHAVSERGPIVDDLEPRGGRADPRGRSPGAARRRAALRAARARAVAGDAVFAAAVVGKAFYVQVATRAETMGRPVRTRQADGAHALPGQSAPARGGAAADARRDSRSQRPAAGVERWRGARRSCGRSTRSSACRSRPPAPTPRPAAIRSAASTFHLLGDAVTRANWGASNTQFVEREADARLRGFGSRVIEGRDAIGRPSSVAAPTADGGTIVPELRRAAAAVGSPRRPRRIRRRRRCSTRPRDVTLTIDARLQARAARLLADRLERLNLTRGAVVVHRRGDRRRARARQLSVAGAGRAGACAPRSRATDRRRSGSIARASASIRRDRRSSW